MSFYDQRLFVIPTCCYAMSNLPTMPMFALIFIRVLCLGIKLLCNANYNAKILVLSLLRDIAIASFFSHHFFFFGN